MIQYDYLTICATMSVLGQRCLQRLIVETGRWFFTRYYFSYTLLLQGMKKGYSWHIPSGRIPFIFNTPSRSHSILDQLYHGFYPGPDA